MAGDEIRVPPQELLHLRSGFAAFKTGSDRLVGDLLRGLKAELDFADRAVQKAEREFRRLEQEARQAARATRQAGAASAAARRRLEVAQRRLNEMKKARLRMQTAAKQGRSAARFFQQEVNRNVSGARSELFELSERARSYLGRTS